MPDKDRLRLTRLVVGANLLQPPMTPGLVNPALSAKDASAIYGEIARFGFSSFQVIPGGAQIASGDGVTIVTLTGAAWSFQEDLDRSVFEHARDKLDVTVSLFMDKLPTGTILLGQSVDLQAVWDGVAQSTDEYVNTRFLRPKATDPFQGIPGMTFNGAGIRLNLSRPPDAPLPTGVTIAGGTPVDSVDVRVEPWFADRSKLFVQVTGAFAPTAERGEVTKRVDWIKQVLWEHVAGSISLEA